MYAEDSFFTLGTGGRLGLLCLSACLASLCVWLVWRTRGLSRMAHVVLALLLFWLFVWLSPQIYYFYYIAIFDDLPWQLVVKRPPDLLTLVRLLIFSESATLSFHSQGMLGWLLVFCALLPRRKKPG